MMQTYTNMHTGALLNTYIYMHTRVYAYSLTYTYKHIGIHKATFVPIIRREQVSYKRS